MDSERLGHILIVEDEPLLAKGLSDYLEAAGYSYGWIDDGANALAGFRAKQPDLVLLDLMLPGRDGIDICRDLRQESPVPVIMITARTEEIDRLLGLEVGADDYICKPFSPREVVARVKAVLRRHRHDPNMPVTGPLSVDGSTYRAKLHGQELPLTPVEFRLLHLLYNAQGRVFSRDQLLDRIYNDRRIVTDRTIDSHLKNLRHKLADAGGRDDWIKSVYGVGYRMEM